MIRRLEKFLFYLFIFTLPFQTRVVLYQFRPVFNEWTSVYLYLTDILLLAVFLLWLWRNKNRRFLKNLNFQVGQWLKSYYFWLLIFSLIGFISLSSSGNLYLGVYCWLKLLELIALFFYLKDCLYISQSEDEFLDYETAQEKIDLRTLALVFVFSGLFQSYMAIRQFVTQSSLGWKYLAESPLSVEINGVAEFVVGGVKFIRPYGSLPHPNVLAAFLMTAIFFLYYLWFTKGHSAFKKYLLLSFYFILLFALFLTFSREVIAVFLIINIFLFTLNFFQGRRKKNKPLLRRTFFIFLLLLIFCSLLFFLARPEIFARFAISKTEQAVFLRGIYNEAALISIADYPLLGSGYGGFVWEFQNMYNLLSGWLHQPVHNIYLLIAAETGLLGLMAFLFFLYLLIKKKPRLTIFCLLLVSFLIIGLFDHFFWTLQQGQMVFWLILGIIAAYGSGSLIIDESE